MNQFDGLHKKLWIQAGVMFAIYFALAIVVAVLAGGNPAPSAGTFLTIVFAFLLGLSVRLGAKIGFASMSAAAFPKTGSVAIGLIWRALASLVVGSILASVAMSIGGYVLGVLVAFAVLGGAAYVGCHYGFSLVDRMDVTPSVYED